MRTHVYGWVILGLALFAPPWNIPEKARPVDRGPAIAASAGAAYERVGGAPPPLAISRVVTVREIAAAAPPGTLPAGPTPAPAPAPAQRTAGATGDALRSGATGSSLPVREFAPGSKAHSEAIASHIASEETQDVFSPLARLYLAYFGRVPDYEGFDYYLGERERGAALDAIADEFAGSREFNTRYGALDNAAFVDRVLQNIFGSPGDAQQRAYWADQLESGRLTRGQVMLIFSESPGFRTLTANEVFVAIAYAETLERAPGPADLARWVEFLDAGNPRRAVIDALLADRRKG